MGDQTDYLAQLMHSESAAPMLDVDLSLQPDCNLANSVAQIAQEAVGRFIADNGGLQKMVEYHTKDFQKQAWRRDRDNFIEDVINDIKDEIHDFVMTLIKSEIEARVKPKTNLDDLRERVENFSLVGADA